jgi:transcriptional regulator with XRE-family HTH domain
MKRLTLQRMLKGWSQARLARESLTNPSTVSLIESGRWRPYEVQLARIAAALGVPALEAGALLEDCDQAELDAIAEGQRLKR